MISILILTYNRFELTQRCLASLWESIKSRGDVEVCLVDNGSDKDMAEWLLAEMKKWSDAGKKTQIALLDVNTGVAQGRSRLLDMARGNVLIFLDSDALIVNPAWLDILREALQPENVGMVGGGGCFVHWNTQEKLAWFKGAPAGLVDVVPGWLQCFKREVLDAGAEIDVRYGLFYEEDSDFCLQFRNIGYDVISISNAGVQHVSADSGAKLADRNFTLRRLYEKWYGKGLVKIEGGY